MPVINGFQVYNELMNDELTRNVKVIFFTASIIGTYKEELEKLKCPAILKPIDTRSFINLINGFI